MCSRVTYVLICTLVCRCYGDSREGRRAEGGHQRSGVDGQDGHDHAGQKHRRQLVDVFDSHEHQQRHQHEEDGAVNAHVVEHGRRLAVRAVRDEDSGAGGHVHLHTTEDTSTDTSDSKQCWITVILALDMELVAPAGSRRPRGCTWRRRRSCPDRSRSPRPRRTRAPENERS